MKKSKKIRLLIGVILLIIIPNMYITIGDYPENRCSVFSKEIWIWGNKDHIGETFDLSPLKKCIFLRSLYITWECDLNVFNDLPDLETLYIRGVKTKDFTPVKNLTKLKDCTIMGCEHLNDAGLFSEMRELECLDIQYANVTDISCLADLKNLTYLQISATNVTDISVVRELPNLETLYIIKCPIEDYSVLLECDNLRALYIYEDQIPDELTDKLIDKFAVYEQTESHDLVRKLHGSEFHK